MFGQALIGIGCAPAFLVRTVFIAKRFPAAQFASVSGLVLGMGGVGLLITGMPLAWVVEAGSWRTGFLVLAVGSALAWLVIFALVREPTPLRADAGPAVVPALRDAAAPLALPHTLGIVALAAVTYASFIALRGLWLGPLHRHGRQPRARVAGRRLRGGAAGDLGVGRAGRPRLPPAAAAPDGAALSGGPVIGVASGRKFAFAFIKANLAGG